MLIFPDKLQVQLLEAAAMEQKTPTIEIIAPNPANDINEIKLELKNIETSTNEKRPPEKAQKPSNGHDEIEPEEPIDTSPMNKDDYELEVE